MNHQEARKEQLNALILELQETVFEREQKLIRFRVGSKEFREVEQEIEHFRKMLTKYQHESQLLKEGKITPPTQDSLHTPGSSKRSQSKRYFVDEFSDNRHNWWTGVNERVAVSISEGFYNFRSKVEQGRVVWYDGQKLDIPLEKGLCVELSIKLIDGPENKAMGVLLGENREHYLDFNLTGNSYYRLGYFANEEWKALNKFTYSSLVNKKGNWNVIKIQREENQDIRFSINGTEIFTRDIDTFNNIRTLGFVVYGDMQILVDYLRVYQD